MNVTGVSACLYCPTGAIADETASTTCRPCASGSSIATLGTVICDNCSVGSNQKVSGQTSCVSCNAGFFVPSIGQTACQACEPGFANDQEEANLCYSCSSGMYSSLYNQTSLSRFWSSRSDVCGTRFSRISWSLSRVIVNFTVPTIVTLQTFQENITYGTYLEICEKNVFWACAQWDSSVGEWRANSDMIVDAAASTIHCASASLTGGSLDFQGHLAAFPLTSATLLSRELADLAIFIAFILPLTILCVFDGWSPSVKRRSVERDMTRWCVLCPGGPRFDGLYYVLPLEWASTVARLQENVDLAWKFLGLLSCFRVVRLPWRRNRQRSVSVHCRLLC